MIEQAAEIQNLTSQVGDLKAQLQMTATNEQVLKQNSVMSSNATPSLFGIQSTQNATGNFQQQVSHMNTLVNKARDNQQMQKMQLEIESDLEHLQQRLY